MNIAATILGVVSEGGPVMYMISAALIAGIVVAVERLIAVESAARVDHRQLLPEAIAKVDHDQAQSALELCRAGRAIQAAALAEVLAEAITPSGPLQAERLRERAEHTVSSRGAALEKRVDLLATAANTTTLLGLLGTVIGLMSAFGPANAPVFGASVARSLHATVYGIVAALPLLLAQSYLRARIDAILSDARGQADRLIGVVVAKARADAQRARASQKDREIAARDREVVHRHGSLLAR